MWSSVANRNYQKKRPYTICPNIECVDNRGRRTWIYTDRLSKQPLCKLCQTNFLNIGTVPPKGKPKFDKPPADLVAAYETLKAKAEEPSIVTAMAALEQHWPQLKEPVKPKSTSQRGKTRKNKHGLSNKNRTSQHGSIVQAKSAKQTRTTRRGVSWNTLNNARNVSWKVNKKTKRRCRKSGQCFPRTKATAIRSCIPFPLKKQPKPSCVHQPPFQPEQPNTPPPVKLLVDHYNQKHSRDDDHYNGKHYDHDDQQPLKKISKSVCLVMSGNYIDL